MATRLTQEAVEALGSGSPGARVTQEPVEVLGSGSPGARVTQEVVEVLAAPNPQARVTQEVVEIIVSVDTNILVSQAGVEAIGFMNPPARLTQAGVEAISAMTPTLRITQAGVEAIVSNTRFLRTLVASAAFRATRSRTIPATGDFSTGNNRTIPSTARFRSVAVRTVPSTARLGNTSFDRTIPASAVWRKVLSRPVPATAQFRIDNRYVPATASFLQETARTIFAFAELGLKRYIPASVALQGNRARQVPSYARLRQAGQIPAYGSFWAPVETWRVVSDSQTRVMALASHLMGGSVGTYYGAVPAAFNGPEPPDWNTLGYNDTFWPHAVSRSGTLVPYPFVDPTILDIDFDWRWPNETNDYSPTGYISGGDPSFAVNLYRREFGLPLDQRSIDATSGSVIVGVHSGTFIATVRTIMINNQNIPFDHYQIDNPSARVGIWTIPSSVLRPGSNILTISTFVYLSFGLFGNSMAYEVNIEYRPPMGSSPQVMG